eukprot:2457461-Amphidinium_carterae.1
MCDNEVSIVSDSIISVGYKRYKGMFGASFAEHLLISVEQLSGLDSVSVANEQFTTSCKLRPKVQCHLEN